MLSLIQKFLQPTQTIQQPLDQNLLYKAIYGQFYVNNLVVWLDNKAETFINQGYRGNAAVYSIVRKIGDKDSEAPLLAYKETAKTRKYKSAKWSNSDFTVADSRVFRKKELQEVESGDLVELLKRPNAMQTQSEFLKEASMFFRLTGEVFIYGVRVGGANIEEARSSGLRDGVKFKELFVLPSHLVTLVQGDMFMPVVGYKFTIGDQTIQIPASEVLHLKMNNPFWDLQGSQLRGQSPLLAGLKYLQKNNEAVASLYRALQNEGAKGFISPESSINPEQWLTSEQLPALKQELEKRWEGSFNKNKVGAAGLPMKYTQIALSPVALDIIAGMKYDDEKLCNLWGMNPVLLSPDGKYDNFNQAKKQLVTDVVMPYLSQLEQGLNDFLLPAFEGEADYIDFDTTVFSELQPDVKMVLETYGKAMGWTWNEIRTSLGWDERPEASANTLWIPSGYVPAEEALEGGTADFRDFQA